MSLTFYLQNSTPMRLKESYFVNLPAYANKVMEFAMGVLNEKLKKRVIVSNLIFFYFYQAYN